MATNYQRLREDVTRTVDEAQAIQTLAEILADKNSRVFVPRLERESAELCIGTLDRVVSRDPHPLPPSLPQMVSSGYRRAMALSSREIGFFVTLRKRVGCYGKFSHSMMVTKKFEAPDEIIASGGSADTRSGQYMGHFVVVMAIRVTVKVDFLKKGAHQMYFPRTWDMASMVGLPQQGSRSLEHAIPSECLEAY